MKTSFLLPLSLLLFCSCSSNKYFQTVDHVNIDKFMGKWYVLASRPTIFEKGAHNAVETYTYNPEKERIDVGFTFNQNSFDGKLKSIPQRAFIANSESNAHWEISPFWPLRFDYLVVALDDDYRWTVIGVPSGKYLWFMARDLQFSDQEIQNILSRVDKQGYPAADYAFIRHRAALDD